MSVPVPAGPYRFRVGAAFRVSWLMGSCLEETAGFREYLLNEGSVIAHGLGRSYGDSALNERVLFTRRLNALLSFDPAAGVLACESGVSLADVIDTFLPKGWFLPVTPGTKFVTVGGAIAGDVHGKNHHKAGCFSNFVLSFRLMLPDGSVVRCSEHENRDLFLATCGGMGLTGLLLSAELKLKPVTSSWIRQKTLKAKNLREVFDCFEQYGSWTYSVAWLDALAGPRDLGRSILMLGEHAHDGGRADHGRKAASIPFDLPGFFLNTRTARLFNDFYYHRVPVGGAESMVPIEKFFYPLDAVRNWNRIYGSGGFIQYHFVLPREASFEGLQAVLNRANSSGLASFLAVLKLCGPANSNYLSFPQEGYSLALDFKVEERLFPLLRELDRVVLDHGGRFYLCKDALMSPEVFRKGYPNWERFGKLRRELGLLDKFSSLQSRRLEI